MANPIEPKGCAPEPALKSANSAVLPELRTDARQREVYLLDKSREFRFASWDHSFVEALIEDVTTLLAQLQAANLEIERLKRVEEFVECTGRARAVLDRAKEAEAKLQAANEALERLTDIVRYSRGELFHEGLITHEEFAALVADSEGGKRVARLEGYDAMKQRVERAESERDEARNEAVAWVVRYNDVLARAEAAEAKLAAVLNPPKALLEELERLMTPTRFPKLKGNYYRESEVRALLSRLREVQSHGCSEKGGEK